MPARVDPACGFPSRPRPRAHRPVDLGRPGGHDAVGADGRPPRLHPVLGCRAPQHAAGRGDQPAGGDRTSSGANDAAAARFGWRDAAQSRAAGRRRAVRPARGRASGPYRPGHRPGTRFRPGDVDGAAWCRGPRRSRHRGLPGLPGRCRRADERARRARPAPRPDAATTSSRPPLPRPPSRSCGCWVRRCTRRTWPPRRACRTCSPTTSPARAPPRRWRSTASEFRPSDLAPEPLTFLTVNAVVAETRDEAMALVLPNLQMMARLRTGQPLGPLDLVEDAEAVTLAPQAQLIADSALHRAVVGYTDGGGRSGARAGRGVRRRRGDGQPGGLGAARHRPRDRAGARHRRWNCWPKNCSKESARRPGSAASSASGSRCSGSCCPSAVDDLPQPRDSPDRRAERAWPSPRIALGRR